MTGPDVRTLLGCLLLMSACGCGAEQAPESQDTASRQASTGEEEAGADSTADEATGAQLEAQPQPESPMIVSPLMEVTAHDREAEELRDELAETLSLGPGHCAQAGDLRDRICELADRICDIAGRHPEDEGVADRCDDGRDRCERATRDVADQCG